MKQYTVTERNYWERETFGYILNLTEAAVKIIEDKVEDNHTLSIEQTTYTKEEAKFIDDASSNGYMSRLDFYQLVDGWEELDDLFYKGIGLEEVDAK